MPEAIAGWQPVDNFSHLEWKASSAPGAIYLRVIGEPSTETIVENRSEFTQWVADHSARPSHVPLGDWIHRITNILQIERCDECAKRQARMNSWLRF